LADEVKNETSAELNFHTGVCDFAGYETLWHFRAGSIPSVLGIHCWIFCRHLISSKRNRGIS